MDNTVTLYGDLFSQPVRAVYAFMVLEGIKVTLVHIDLLKGENKNSDYKEKVHPGAKMPVIAITKEGGKENFKLFESHAILRYLQSEYCSDKISSQHWYPTALKGEGSI